VVKGGSSVMISLRCTTSNGICSYMWAAALEASATDQEIGIGSEFRVLLGRTVRSNQFSPRTLPALCTILSNFPEPKG
jgi:hypothetical protein